MRKAAAPAEAPGLPETAELPGREVVIDYRHTVLARRLTVGSVVSFHYYDYAPGFRGIQERHDFWELVYCDGDPIVCVADGRMIPLEQGQAVLHPPWEAHNIFSANAGGKACILSFVCGQLDPEPFRGRRLTLDDAQRETVGLLFREGRELFAPPYNLKWQESLQLRPEAPFGAEQLFLNRLEILLVLLVRGLTALPTGEGLPEGPVISAQAKRSHFNEACITEAVKGILKERLDRRLSMDDISRLTAFSKSYIHAVFKKHTGESVMGCFISMKIERAKKLINENRCTFTEISAIMGFGSVHYFSRLFRAKVGMSPSEYRESVKMLADL